jgi:hypothetical protein
LEQYGPQFEPGLLRLDRVKIKVKVMMAFSRDYFNIISEVFEKYLDFPLYCFTPQERCVLFWLLCSSQTMKKRGGVGEAPEGEKLKIFFVGDGY